MLNPASGGRYADGTAGGGGHAEALLKKSAPDGWLFACDRDGDAIEACRNRLVEFKARFELRHCDFSEIGTWVRNGVLDGALLDLGVSSPQLDLAHRGFSLNRDGPLDMRQDVRQVLRAQDILDEWDEMELARLFFELGGERHARRYAKVIAQRRGTLKSTLQLSQLIEKFAVGGWSPIHPATKIFQALRMAVNDELGHLERGLRAVWGCLRSHGRLAVISFHSGEDRLVKLFGRGLTRDYELPVGASEDIPELRRPKVPEARWITKKAIQPSSEEVAINPRSRSARLRVLEKLVFTHSDDANDSRALRPSQL